MSIQQLPPKACHDLREADPAIPLIDVRTPQEFAAGHPEGALNVPIFVGGPFGGMQPNPGFADLVRQVAPDPAQRVIFSCAVGGRSHRACELLANAGYPHTINMVGGFNGARQPDGTVIEKGWAEAGLPVSTDPGDRSWQALQAKHGG